jgi:hypothetical protein
MLQAMGVQKTVSVNPNNQKEMNEENQNGQRPRLHLEPGEFRVAPCDSCEREILCRTFNLKRKELVFCGPCFIMFSDVMFQVKEGLFRAYDLEDQGFRPAPDGYQPEPDIHDIEMVGSELWIKDKE